MSKNSFFCLKIRCYYGSYSWAPEKLWDGPDWLAGIENASKQRAWMDCIEIIYFGPQIDLFSTLLAPKRAGFAPKWLLWTPWRCSFSSKKPYLVPNCHQLVGLCWCQGYHVPVPHIVPFRGSWGHKKGPVLSENTPFAAL